MCCVLCTYVACGVIIFYWCQVALPVLLCVLLCYWCSWYFLMFSALLCSLACDSVLLIWCALCDIIGVWVLYFLIVIGVVLSSV